MVTSGVTRDLGVLLFGRRFRQQFGFFPALLVERRHASWKWSDRRRLFRQLQKMQLFQVRILFLSVSLAFLLLDWLNIPIDECTDSLDC